MFALVDANSFYCSAEQVFRPEWRGRPIVVLSNNDGCIVAANRQAIDAGVPKFEPYFKVKALCDRLGIIALSSNYELYGSLSASMMEVIGRFAPEQHVYSIDESFLSFKHCYPAIPCLVKHGEALRRAVWKETRLPVSVGMGETLTLAKIANHAAKKIADYNGVCVIDNSAQRKAILSQIKPSHVWGIGRRLSKKLDLMGIKSAYALSQMAPGLAKKQFSIEMERTVRELNGEPCKGWDQARADKQQIFSTRSMGERITDPSSLQQALSKHAGIATSKAREQGSLCSVLLIFASNSPFDEQPTGFKLTHRFAYPTNDTGEITQIVTQIAKQQFKAGVRYYKVGVGLIDLINESHNQLDLFASPKNPALMKVYDALNHKYGSDSIFMAAQGFTAKWHMKREYLTPQYTTSWRDIPKINC
ncbi:Y-family DNA polymerase [Shewanella sp.]|uniref:Y-family DNA polymerase n=1 Tax=Shewanella sp. TaxID=50422 RepID=UPI00258D60F6|nr:Y-family DNA polymerase [Shewanella sp.]MCJ8304980.1 Y-family DNA polymerase [Shewanella sp.]